MSCALLWVAVLVLAAVCEALLLNDGTGSEPICAAKEYSGGVSMTIRTVVDGKPHVEQSLSVMHYSALQRKILVTRLDVTPPETHLFDYTQGVTYAVTSQSGGDEVCTNTSLAGPFVYQCIPENHTTLVSPGPRFGLGLLTTYSFQMPESDTSTQVTFTDDNLPLTETIYSGDNYFQNMFYFNMTKATFTPDTFDIPPSCR